LRLTIKAAQFVKVALAGLAVARFHVFLAQGRVKLRQAGISGRRSQPFLDLRESPADVPSGLGAACLGHAKLNKLFPLAVQGECAQTLGMTVAGIKFQSLLKQGFGGTPVSFQNGLSAFYQRIQKGPLHGRIAFILAMSSAQSL
jgi:hypothetical protein